MTSRNLLSYTKRKLGEEAAAMESLLTSKIIELQLSCGEREMKIEDIWSFAYTILL
jgi:hypothetical protein